MWVDEHWANVEGGRASVEFIDGNIYLAAWWRPVAKEPPGAGPSLAALEPRSAESSLTRDKREYGRRLERASPPRT